ncbi:MAG: hypothetical protein ACI9BW_000802 [Gammaproteobacteria bacterium]|jgi:hypothetical protein
MEFGGARKSLNNMDHYFYVAVRITAQESDKINVSKELLWINTIM